MNEQTKTKNQNRNYYYNYNYDSDSERNITAVFIYQWIDILIDFRRKL